MGYRDDFYTVDNIIGITGPVDSLPTVYFQNTKTGEYGHITQVHAYDWNQGRCEVEADQGYRIENKCGGNCNCNTASAHEFNSAGLFHVSRASFVPRANLSQQQIDVAAQAIWRCPHMKTDPMTEHGRDHQDLVYEQRWQNAHARGANGRRGAVDYSAEGLGNRLLQIAHPGRV